MLTRSFKPLKNLLNLNCRCFSTAAYSDYSNRVSSIRSQYPGLFSSNFESEQEDILSNFTSSSISSRVDDYNRQREQVYNTCGEDLFMTLNADEVVNARRNLERSSAPDDSDAQTRLEIGTNLMNELSSVYDSSPSDVQGENLRMVRISETADALQLWRLTLQDPLDDDDQLGLPIADSELDEWVFKQFSNAPGPVRSGADPQGEEQWLGTLDERAYDELLSNRGVDRSKWLDFCNTTNEMFHPNAIDHYGFTNQAKLLFRGALWDSENTVNEVASSMQELSRVYNTGRDNDSGILRRCYELYPQLPYRGLAAYYLSITDPLFSARLVNEVRDALVNQAFERAVRDVTRDFELNIINNELTESRNEYDSGNHSTVVVRKIRELEAEIAAFDVEPSSLDTILDEILPVRLWGNDISNVRSSILSYANGNGSLNDISSSIESTLNPNLNENENLNEDQIVDLMIRYHNAKRDELGNMNLDELLNYVSLVDQRREQSTVIFNRRVIRLILENNNVHPLVVTLVKSLVDNGQATLLPRVLQDFDAIIKIYRGELDGVITSARELSSDELNAIRNAIESQNVGKKITLETAVDSTLQAGFVVSIGVNKWNFSLANVVDQGRRQVEKQQ